ncbi:retrovirus-related pol polyprotein from transposon tnt 1-94 [Cucumis melo var. makuwa]|uniref:Retrovirus-related pol polyprotein from transposon tnt 1-94 n=1 Tax=Cucumis melo var. makuwa TaxID=1194695 RepID=A0A5A7V7C8_CUCMM|nr:retrovirus-related pol polyprotein from transposon tnt 1-94 [Cucumis melo var. makuwa]TYK27521.1 retrovirus-related pol polyprotein from transposon tnt 1-94 [Cucumis melo var. makuwa]
MLKSIRILLPIATFYDYEIWHMDVKTAFLNGNLEGSTYMDQPKGFIQKGENKRIINTTVVFLVLYVDDILLIGNDVGHLTDIKKWLAMQFQMKDLGNAQYVLGMVSKYQSNSEHDYWTAVKNIIKYLRRTKDYMLVYGSKDLILTGYSDSDFQSDKDARKSTSESVFTLNVGAVGWRSIKQSCIADSIWKLNM